MDYPYAFLRRLRDAMNALDTVKSDLFLAAYLARDTDTQAKVEAIRQEIKILREKLRQIYEVN